MVTFLRGSEVCEDYIPLLVWLLGKTREGKVIAQSSVIVCYHSPLLTFLVLILRISNP